MSVNSGCYNRLPYTGWFKKQTFISRNSGAWDVQGEGVGRSDIWGKLLSL